ncbi:hypothetical protein DFJ74DRAFT_655745 [Hyaloraphidium curvatum]|nr:hypothetical protein DFJ74DRAFT_655745 [Hyaloraphidium curvatum]
MHRESAGLATLSVLLLAAMPATAATVGLRVAFVRNYTAPEFGFDALAPCTPPQGIAGRIAAVGAVALNGEPGAATAEDDIAAADGSVAASGVRSFKLRGSQSWLLPDVAACNFADEESPLWLVGTDKVLPSNPSGNSQGSRPIGAPATSPGGSFAGIVSGSRTTRFLIYDRGWFATDVGEGDGPGSYMLRYDGGCPNEAWRTAFQIPLLRPLLPKESARMLHTRKLLYSDEVGPMAVGLVYNGADPASDLGTPVGMDDIFALRFDASTGKLLAHAQFDAGTPSGADRIHDAFLFRDPGTGAPRLAVLSFEGFPTNVGPLKLTVLDALDLHVLNRTDFTFPQPGLYWGGGAVAPRDEPYFILASHGQISALSLFPDRLGQLLGSVTLSRTFNWPPGCLAYVGTEGEGGPHVTYLRGRDHEGPQNKYGSGTSFPVLAKLFSDRVGGVVPPKATSEPTKMQPTTCYTRPPEPTPTYSSAERSGRSKAPLAAAPLLAVVASALLGL